MSSFVNTYRGNEEAIARVEKKDGNLLFAYDTGRIFLDVENERYPMGTSGASFLYSDSGLENTDDVFTLPLDSIDTDRLQPNDIVVSGDNVICRVDSIDAENNLIYVTPLASGGGGGGTSSGRTLTVKPFDSKTTQWPDYAMVTAPVSAQYVVTSNQSADVGVEVDVQVSVGLYNSSNTLVEELYHQPIVGVYIGTPFDIQIPAGTFRSTNNYVTKITVEAIYDETKKSATRSIQIYNITFGDNPASWNPRKQFALSGADAGIEFGYSFQGIDTNIPGYIKAYVDSIPVKESSSSFIQTSGVFGITATDLNNAGITHGAHLLTIEGYAIVGGIQNLVNSLTYNVMIIDPSDETPIIISPYAIEPVEELNYNLINIPFMVYQKGVANPLVRLYINGELDKTINVTTSINTYENWEIVKYNLGVNIFRISCGDTSKVFEIPVIETEETRKLNPIVDGLLLDLNAYGRSNNESTRTRATWKYSNTASGASYEAQFRNFNWYNNGWISNNTTDNETVLRLTNGAELSIPISEIFNTEQAKECTIEIEMKPRNILDFARLITTTQVPVLDPVTGEQMVDKYGNKEYEMRSQKHTEKGVVCRYYNNNAGICIGTQEAFLTTDKTLVNVRYAENQKTKLTFVVDILKQAAGSQPEGVLYAYVNGVMSGAARFVNDDFNSNTNVLSFNSDYCDLDIYRIKIYNRALNYGEITQNWAADASTLQEKQERYKDNGAIVSTTETGDAIIDYELIRYSKDNKMPLMVISTYVDPNGDGTTYEPMPYNKSKKIYGDVRFYHPEFNGENGTENKCFRAQNVEISVQGTSSQGYPRRNYKIKLKNPKDKTPHKTSPYKLQTWDGEEYDVTNGVWNGKDIGKYNMSLLGDDLSETPFCLKADYMESSSTHNTGLANFIQNVSTQFNGTGGYNLRHPLVKRGVMDNGDARTTIYGYPILLFHDHHGSGGKPEFIGKYNFNLDKGATDVFGFTNGSENPYAVAEDRTYENVSECWELLNNKGTRCSFLTPPEQFFALDSEGKLEVVDDFEARYHVADFDPGDMYDEASAATNPEQAKEEVNTLITGYMDNFYKMYQWVYSTNPETATNQPLPAGESYWMRTQDTEYGLIGDQPKKYYYVNGDNTHYIFKENTSNDEVVTLKEVNGGTETIHKYTFTLVEKGEGDNKETDIVYVYTYSVNGGTEQADSTKDVVSLDLIKPNLAWFECHEYDTKEYRLAKFKNEFDLHFDKSYCLFYYILTNVLIMFDSRSKNMMLASWGPETEGGEYIWYPIFYDMDTQLGVNNSGVVYWDYDCEPDDPLNPIYSGASSVLWKNVHLCFQEAIQALYRQLRAQGLISYNTLMKYYQIDGSNKWSEAMKNADAFFKYIAPALSVADGYGYINQSGAKTGDDFSYLYCLQGDRALLQEALFTNRLNYKDSQWGAGSYTAGVQGGAQIQLRYNANSVGTSDPTQGEPAQEGNPLESDGVFNIKTYLSQYCTVFFDITPVRPFVRYDANAAEDSPAVINLPESQREAIKSGSDLQQQLLYIYGPEYIKSLGDLSTKYLDEIKIGNAIRLRDLKVGNDIEGYYNNRMKSSEALVLGSSEGAENAKSLLSYIDFSNLGLYTHSVDIGGCIKLETFKALGSQISSVVLPKGSIFHTIYLPHTINQLQLLAPQNLNEVIYDKSITSRAATNANEGIEHRGLYIDKITSEVNIANDGTYSYSLTNMPDTISDYRTDATKLKYDTYILLEMLTKKKWETKTTMTISMLNVDWTPYVRLESDAAYTDYLSGTLYYKDDDQTYKSYDRNVFMAGGSISQDKWSRALNGQGVYVKKDVEKLIPVPLETELVGSDTYYSADGAIIDNASGNSDGTTYRKIVVKNPITSLDLLKYYTDANFDSAHQYFKAPGDLANQMPEITGSMHIDNNEASPVDEYELYSIYKTAFPNLDITANALTPCYRAKFVEYLPDGSIVEYGNYKAAFEADSMIVPQFNEDNPAPSRQHYDFLGWTKKDISANNCVVLSADSVEIVTNFATETFAGNPVYYAVFKLHQYKISIYDALNESHKIGEVFITSGEQIGDNLNNIDTYKDATELEFDKIWKFTGYKRTLQGAVVDVTHITVNEDITLYAMYVEDSIKNNPLTDDDLMMLTDNAVHPKRQLKGKICFPVECNGRPILRIYGAGGYTNNLQNNSTITHVFFADGSQVKNIGFYAFNACSELRYFEFPDSLSSLAEGAFNACFKLAVTDTNNVYDFQSNSLSYRNDPTFANEEKTLQISGGSLSFGAYALNNTRYETITLGSQEEPVTGFQLYGGALISQETSTTPNLTAINIYWRGREDVIQPILETAFPRVGLSYNIKIVP